MSSNKKATQAGRRAYPGNIVMTNCNNVSTNTYTIGGGNDHHFMKSFDAASNMSNSAPSSGTAQDEEAANILFGNMSSARHNPIPPWAAQVQAAAKAATLNAINAAFANMPSNAAPVNSIPPRTAQTQTAAHAATNTINNADIGTSSYQQKMERLYPNVTTIIENGHRRTYVNGRLVSGSGNGSGTVEETVDLGSVRIQMSSHAPSDAAPNSAATNVPPPKYADVVGNGSVTSNSNTDAPVPSRLPPLSELTTTVTPPAKHATGRNMAKSMRSSWANRISEMWSKLWRSKSRSRSVSK
ncbi:hypothetical protein CVT25_009216 [Psilocybe cyanescens]|uniref:Uncharacterized protein n=1 Tax=Psilocybe cyanescens TaxID=93625 RepID=A0A409WWF8_PSICY|nr:hypothetical protein CVT25_009216 [Psilocybe cyanescens]